MSARELAAFNHSNALSRAAWVERAERAEVRAERAEALLALLTADQRRELLLNQMRVGAAAAAAKIARGWRPRRRGGEIAARLRNLGMYSYVICNQRLLALSIHYAG
jgi:hypothetical protein